jgi:hypothetical protein
MNTIVSVRPAGTPNSQLQVGVYNTVGNGFLDDPFYIFVY